MTTKKIQLAHAIAALQNKDAQLALKLCDIIQASMPATADVYHVKALAAKQLGNSELAAQNFLNSLQLQPNQGIVHSNYANLLMEQGNYEQASEHYCRSLSITKSNRDAWFNWAVLVSKMGKYHEAINKLNEAIKIFPQDARLCTILGNAYRELEEFDSAIQAYNQALKLNSNDIQALHNLGTTFRVANMAAKSIVCYEKILSLNQHYPELYFNLGCAFYDLGEKNNTVKYLNQAISMKADYVEAHEALNKFYWESGDHAQFAVSYQQQLSKAPQSSPLWYSYAAMLIMAQQYENALEVLNSAVTKLGREHQFLHAIAVIKNRISDRQDVYSLLQEASNQQPNNVKYRIDLANYHVTNQDYQTALKHLEHAQKIMPLNQEILAYQGLCYRLLDSPKSKWLNDYDTFIQAKLLDVPSNYRDLAHFMAELRAALIELHKTEHQPLDQSVKGGTQTVGRLLSEPVKVIQEFKQVLESRVSKYLAELPQDPLHPFLNRNTQQFKFSGSWSVKLSSGGFHINHVHPEGWLSCCTYVTMPGNVNSNDPLKAGWVKFGETSLKLKDREWIGKQICPEEGLCVLFPSYFWHGTNTFESASCRLTIPCDIMPISA